MSLDDGLSVIGLLAALACGPDPPTRATARIETDAEQAARSWLSIVDTGNYEESWHAASELFRQDMARFGKDLSFWVRSLGVSREPLGSVAARDASSIVTRTEAGFELAEIVYESAFVNAPEADVRETILMTLEDDGEWRMVSYRIER